MQASAPTAVPTAAPTAVPTAPPTAVPTLAPTAAPGSMKIQYKIGGDTASDNTIKPYILIVNNSGSAINLSEYTVRYYYTKESASSETVDKYNATCRNANIANTFTTGYIQYGFATGAGILANGVSCEVQTAIHTTDWQNYNETNDYSYDSAKTAYADSSKITLYRNGTLIWGIEPTGAAPTSAPTAITTPAPTAIATTAPTAVPTAVPTAAPGTETIVTGSNISFNTTFAVVFKTQATISGWGVSNFDGRTISVTINGTGTAVTTIGATLPVIGANDYYVFNCSAGISTSAYVFWW